MKYLRSQRGLLYICGSLLLLSIPGLNCHSPTSLVPNTGAAVESQDSSNANLASAPVFNKTQRRPASLDIDGAPQGEPKVRLPASLGMNAAMASSMGLASLLSSPDDVVLPKGIHLLALYDNECRGKDSVLKIEAEELLPKENISMEQLQAEAEADPCLIRIDENKEIALIDPLPSNTRAAFKAMADETAALAIVDDPRASEARHITFSKALTAWDSLFSDAAMGASNFQEDVIVAIVDSGVLSTHPDLKENAYINSAGKNGYDFVNNDEDPTDDNGHGTHVAGIVGARANNGIGVTGVMGTRVKIMGVKVLAANGQGDFASAANGVRYAADKGAHVINMSLGGATTAPALRDALAYAAGKGVVIILAAGNNGQQLSISTFFAPASYAKDIPGVIAVGSVDAQTGARSGFSNYSTEYVWIGAPGSNGILSTHLNDSYRAMDGTSMASPVVAGAAALLVGAYRSRGLTYTSSEVIDLLTESARVDDTLSSYFRNGATLDIERAAKLFFSRHIMATDAGTEIVNEN